MIKNKKVKITELGFLSYSEAWDIQEEYFSKTIAMTRFIALLLQNINELE